MSTMLEQITNIMYSFLTKVFHKCITFVFSKIDKTNKTIYKIFGIRITKRKSNFTETTDYRQELIKWYKYHTGNELNLTNPKTFCEKIQWLKLYDSTEIKKQLTDKYLVREWIKEKIGSTFLVDLIGVYKDPKEIDFKKLPNSFVIKCNHGSGYNIIVKNKNEINKKKTIKKLKKWLSEDYSLYSLELQYKNIKPCILIEEYIGDITKSPDDYKIFCFNGKAHFIEYLTGRDKLLQVAFYTPFWERIYFPYTYPQAEKDIIKPTRLDNMIEIAEKLSKDFSFVRVDFYILPNGDIKFGEMTFTPAAGLCNFPKEMDIEMGNKLELPIGK